MSLISGANFAAPLRSKVQIVGIFALAVLVAVLRLAQSSTGGDATDAHVASEGSRTAATRDTLVSDDVDSYLASRRKAKSRDTEGSGSGDVTVDKLLQGGGSDAEPRRLAKQEADERAAEPEKLNDIKRSLGLE